MDQNELKRLVGKAALNYVKDGDVLGVGTGSTVDCFIDALAQSGIRPSACVSSSERSTKKLLELGFKVIDLSEVEEIGVYVDGADEINDDFEMIKGGALTREKIVASVAKMFVCIADESKLVKTLGKFPLPVEVIPMAVSSVARSLRKLGADPVERDFTTDNGCRILDCRQFMIESQGDGTNHQRFARCRDRGTFCCARCRRFAARYVRRRQDDRKGALIETIRIGTQKRAPPCRLALFLPESCLFHRDVVGNRIHAVAEKIVFALAQKVLSYIGIGAVQTVFIDHHRLKLYPFVPRFFADVCPDALAEFARNGRIGKAGEVLFEFCAMHGTCHSRLLLLC